MTLDFAQLDLVLRTIGARRGRAARGRPAGMLSPYNSLLLKAPIHDKYPDTR